MSIYVKLSDVDTAALLALSPADQNICAIALGLAGIGFEKDGANDCFRCFDAAMAHTIITDKTQWSAAVTEFNAQQASARHAAYTDPVNGTDSMSMKILRQDPGAPTLAELQAAVAAIREQYPYYTLAS